MFRTSTSIRNPSVLKKNRVHRFEATANLSAEKRNRDVLKGAAASAKKNSSRTGDRTYIRRLSGAEARACIGVNPPERRNAFRSKVL